MENIIIASGVTYDDLDDTEILHNDDVGYSLDNENESEEIDNTESVDNTGQETSTSETPVEENFTYDPTKPTLSIFNKEGEHPTFKDETDRANYFEAAYYESKHQFFNNVKQTILDNYKQELLQTEANVDIAKDLVSAIEQGQVMPFLRQHFSKELTQNSYNIKYSPDEIQDIIHQRLTDKFGDNYMNDYDINQLRMVNSLSYKIFKEQQKIENELEEENLKYEPAPVASNEPQQIDPVAMQTMIDQSYKDFEGIGFDRNTFDTWVSKDLPNVYNNLNMMDMYIVQNFKALVRTAKEQERKKMTDEIRKAGGTSLKQETPAERVVKKNKYEDIHDYYNR